ncbi:MAG: helix-turn-helix transcriptional regulator [Rhodospirillaceae bacterium]|nr:helix-turn-helix transcriptional regulator [Rhodospirillaceae bacterium]
MDQQSKPRTRTVQQETVHAGWNRALARVLSADNGARPAALIDAVETLAAFEGWSLIVYRGEDSPSIAGCPPEDRPGYDDYVAGAYLLDPFFIALRQGREPGCWFLREVAPVRFLESEYYRQHYKQTRAVDEANVTVALRSNFPNEMTGCLSIARTARLGRFTPAERRRLVDAAPVIAALLKLALADAGPALGAAHSALDTPHQRVDSVLERMGAGILSAREREVVQLLFRGHSAKGSARMLGIAPGTIQNHMKAVHRKLGVGSQAELFAMFMDVLLHPEGASITPPARTD